MAEEELSVNVGPGGVSGAFKGSQMLPLLLALFMAAWVWYLVIYVQDARAAEREKARVVASEELTKAIKDLAKASEKQDETQRTMIFVLTMPQAKREKLGLAEPRQLRELQR